eukprot:CAMPEP_0115506674 /NCGR_PEP_ID=MMETSP0271-20121206/71295_1 /TAXON_ID=71861 /ORGANISM="Scrippsiella trochoidea, Strain CCMP3099" /LENGTH=225 /DNA_ID=CAMNT_0002936167 /DNA_START=117 /DNA_END=791 /DNA_ORIENTATION=-
MSLLMLLLQLWRCIADESVFDHWVAAERRQCLPGDEELADSWDPSDDVLEVSLLEVSTKVTLRSSPPQSSALSEVPKAVGSAQMSLPTSAYTEQPFASKSLDVAELLLAAGGDPLIAGATAADVDVKTAGAGDKAETEKSTQVAVSRISSPQHTSNSLSDLSAFVPKIERDPAAMIQVRTKHIRAESGTSLLQRIRATFTGLSIYMPKPDVAPVVMLATANHEGV